MARIFNDYLFIHSAKTGGTFFREALNRFGIPNFEVGKKHDSYSTIIKENPECVNYTSFGFVRHPVDWYRSRWAYAKMTYFKEKLAYMPEAQKHWMAKIWDDDLNMFIENTLLEYPDGIATKYFDDMINGCNFSFQYENLLAVTRHLLTDVIDNYVDMNLIEKPILQSEKVKSTIDPILVKEIKKTEFKLMNHYNYE